MWSYYGRKSKIIKHYPDPIYDTIIEPFAGTAVYSLYNDNWKKEVILIEKDNVLVDLWDYLIQASPKDILNLPDLVSGDDIREFNLSKEERYFIGFWINRGSNKPKNIVTKWFTNEYWTNKREEISNDLHKIRHWKVLNHGYETAPSIHATWFIDPPYQHGGEHYICSNEDINYYDLARWCQKRKGQIIVCENSKADWMDFVPLIDLHGQSHKTTEVIWQNRPSIGA